MYRYQLLIFIHRSIYLALRLGVPFVVVVAGKYKSAGLFEIIDVYKGETKFLVREELLHFLSSSSKNP